LPLTDGATSMLTRFSFRSSRSLIRAWYVDACCRMGNRSVTLSVISSRGRDLSLTRQSYGSTMMDMRKTHFYKQPKVPDL